VFKSVILISVKEVNDIKRTADNLQTEHLERLEQDLIKLSKRSYVLKKFISKKTAGRTEKSIKKGWKHFHPFRAAMQE